MTLFKGNAAGIKWRREDTASTAASVGTSVYSCTETMKNDKQFLSLTLLLLLHLLTHISCFNAIVFSYRDARKVKNAFTKGDKSMIFILPNERGTPSEAELRLKKVLALFYQGQHVISWELITSPRFYNQDVNCCMPWMLLGEWCHIAKLAQLDLEFLTSHMAKQRCLKTKKVLHHQHTEFLLALSLKAGSWDPF